MALLKGIRYNFRGLVLGLKTPSLFLLGTIRLVVILALTLIAVGLVLSKYQELTNLVWSQPESAWLAWLWYLVSWLFALLLVGLSALVAFLISQLLFSIVIMDYMSRITERKFAGKEAAPPDMPWIAYFFFLLKQEVPRATIPIIISIVFMLVGWLTPLSAATTLLAPVLAITFLAWDNTDLVPARRLEPFRSRFRFLRQHLSFHVGFGLGFLVPGLNILLISFAPIGGTLFYLEQMAPPPEGNKQVNDSPLQSDNLL